MAAREPGSRVKLREFFVANVGKVFESEELRKVAGNVSEWGRRIRELRDQEGMDIQTHNDRSDLKPGQYVLNSRDLLPAFDRAISKEVRAYVLDRNGFTCQMCGVAAGEPHPYDGRKTRLHIGHIVDKSMGGPDVASNLRAVCSVCNEGAANTTLDRPTSNKLLAQIRRAPGSDQLNVLRWLVRKFPSDSRRYIEDADED